MSFTNPRQLNSTRVKYLVPWQWLLSSYNRVSEATRCNLGVYSRRKSMVGEMSSEAVTLPSWARGDLKCWWYLKFSNMLIRSLIANQKIQQSKIILKCAEVSWDPTIILSSTTTGTINNTVYMYSFIVILSLCVLLWDWHQENYTMNADSEIIWTALKAPLNNFKKLGKLF